MITAPVISTSDHVVVLSLAQHFSVNDTTKTTNLIFDKFFSLTPSLESQDGHLQWQLKEDWNLFYFIHSESASNMIQVNRFKRVEFEYAESIIVQFRVPPSVTQKTKISKIDHFPVTTCILRCIANCNKECFNGIRCSIKNKNKTKLSLFVS